MSTSFATFLRTLMALAIASFAAAQDDARDKVTRNDGKVLTGRVLVPDATDELILLQGGKRVRIPRADVREMSLVRDAVREFCERRVRQRGSTKAQEFLIDDAVARGLPGLAKVQATWLALTEDDEKAHTFLGHRKGPKGWLWEHEGRALTREQLDVALGKQPMTLVGERFSLRCDADLALNTAALLDLEHLGVAWFARYGEALQLREVLEPMLVTTYRTPDVFPKWGFRPMPYYVPPPHEDVGKTFYAGSAPQRPQKMFFVGTQALLYHTLIGDADRRDARDRVCAWLEIGLGMNMEFTMQGDAGYAVPGPLRAQDLLAMQALGTGYRLNQITHLPMYGGFYLMDDAPTATNWTASTMFVAWLLDDENPFKTRDAFLRYVREALAEKKGDSSSLFDKAMGRRIEDFDEPWRAWLAKKKAG